MPPEHLFLELALPPTTQHGYRAYPLVDHIADKVCAIHERHGEAERPSTRYRDLVDLVVIVGAAGVKAEDQRRALDSEAERRGLTLPGAFEVPDRSLWEPGYAAEAGRSLLYAWKTLDEALAMVRPFTDPLLDGSATGGWNSRSAVWS